MRAGRHGPGGERGHGTALYVFYDGWCPLCRRAVAVWRRLDWLRRVEWISFRQPGIVERFGVDPERAVRRIQVHLGATGPVTEGFDAVVCIASGLPVLWPLVPLLAAMRWFGLGQRVYDWLAGRRKIIPTGGCSTAGDGGSAAPVCLRLPHRERFS